MIQHLVIPKKVNNKTLRKSKGKRQGNVHVSALANSEAQKRTNKCTNWKVGTDERTAESSEETKWERNMLFPLDIYGLYTYT